MKFKVAIVFASALAIASAQFPHKPSTLKRSTSVEKQVAKTSEEIDKYTAQLDKTEQVLSSVAQAKGDELKKQYKSFTKEVDSLGKAQGRVTSAIRQLDSKGNEYKLSSEQTVNNINDPELKQASVERKSKLGQDYESIVAKLIDIDGQLQPFMRNLRDLEAFLGADLRPANVNNAAGKIERSSEAAGDLRNRIADVQTGLRNFLNEPPL